VTVNCFCAGADPMSSYRKTLIVVLRPIAPGRGVALHTKQQ
jgi:hypothetical protein